MQILAGEIIACSVKCLKNQTPGLIHKSFNDIMSLLPDDFGLCL